MTKDVQLYWLLYRHSMTHKALHIILHYVRHTAERTRSILKDFLHKNCQDCYKKNFI